MTGPTRPPTLRAFLEAGGDPNTIDRVGMLVEYAALLDTTPPATVEHQIEDRRWTVDHLLEGQPLIPGGGQVVGSLQDLLACMAWEADLAEDRSLIPLLLERLSPALQNRYTRERYCSLHPYPLSVETSPEGSSGWSCGNCGATYNAEDGVAYLTIGYQVNWSDDLDGTTLTYCAACVAMAADALRVTVSDGAS